MMRRLRLFLIVTVAVLVAGTGLTSASALWSQRADVAATVTTGTWVVQDGTWHPAPTFTVSDIDRGLVWTSFTVTWTVPDREVTAYSLDVSGIGTDVRHNPAQNSARVTIPNNFTYRMTLRASMRDGQPMETIIRNLHYSSWNGTVTIR